MFRKEKSIYIKIDYVFVFLIGLLYFTWSCHMMQSWAPDEYMRDDVAFWIANNHKLPIGDESDLRNPIWGKSYAFSPYLTSIIGSIFIRVVKGGTGNIAIHLVALRMVSVLSGMGVACVSLKIGRRLFSNRISDYIFSGMICLLPQFVFLCSYFNCDSFAVLTGVIIIYFSVCAIQEGWNYKNSIGLGVGIGLCALSYYNAYGFILCSIFLYIGIWVKREKIDICNFLKFGMIIVGVAFLIAGWYFIRNGIIYRGDFFGMKASSECSELYAVNEFKPSNRLTLLKDGKTIFALFEGGSWIKSVLKSFIGVFGYMNIPLPDKLVIIYFVVYAMGIFSGIIVLVRKRQYPFGLVCLLLTMVIPIVLAAYYSYASDYQPQGRYCIPLLPGLALISSGGFDQLFTNRTIKIQNGILLSILGVWFFLFGFAFVNVIVPQCWCFDFLKIVN